MLAVENHSALTGCDVPKNW